MQCRSLAPYARMAGGNSEPLPPNRLDFVVRPRSFHRWLGEGAVNPNLKRLFDAMRQSGHMGVEQRLTLRFARL
jgi:hypothetical protein